MTEAGETGRIQMPRKGWALHERQAVSHMKPRKGVTLCGSHYISDGSP